MTRCRDDDVALPALPAPPGTAREVSCVEGPVPRHGRPCFGRGVPSEDCSPRGVFTPSGGILAHVARTDVRNLCGGAAGSGTGRNA